MSQRIPTTRLLVLAGLAALAGCVLLDRMRTEEEVFGFDHAVHVEEGLECSSCHATYEESDDPGMPPQRLCALCHEDIDEEKPPEERVEALYGEEGYRRTARSRLDEEVIFSHQVHATGSYACDDCHTGIEGNERVGRLPRLEMDDCTSCHEEAGAPNECATCHSVIDEDWPPPGHAHAWTERHGEVFRSGSTAVADRCELCHDEETCNTCHQEVAPANHTSFWRRRGHMVTARMDRESCSACHRPDFCIRCHDEVLPLSHRGAWGGTQSRHCLTCHFPLPTQGCITCHEATPSHQMATPLPADPPHSPALNCRQCHGMGASLPHVDKGDECILCHR